jgi:hypothetical protein
LEKKVDKYNEFRSSKKKLSLALGFYSSLILTILGVIYFVVILILFITGKNTIPPSEPVQLFGAIETILMAPLLIIIFTSIHYIISEDKKILSHLGIIFCSIFAVMVSINRFVQLIVVRLSVIAGDIKGLERFYPYEPGSAMFALEMVGWGIFLSIALFLIAFVFSSKGLQKYIRISFFSYAILGILGSIGLTINSPISAIGFVAWGFILPVSGALLSVFFYKYKT